MSYVKISEEIKRDKCPKPQKDRSRGNKKGQVSRTTLKKNGHVPSSRISLIAHGFFSINYRQERTMLKTINKS